MCGKREREAPLVEDYSSLYQDQPFLPPHMGHGNQTTVSFVEHLRAERLFGEKSEG